MRKIDESERPMPEVDLAKVCFIIEKSREYFGEEVGAEADNSNPTDDDERVMLTETAGPSIRARTDRIHQGSRRRRSCGGRRARLDRAGRFPARRVENCGCGGKGAGRGPDLEIPPRDGTLARLPGGRAFRLRPFLRGSRIRGRRMRRPGCGCAHARSVDSELSCPVLIAHQMSAASVCSPVGGVGKLQVCSCRPQRRAAEWTGLTVNPGSARARGATSSARSVGTGLPEALPSLRSTRPVSPFSRYRRVQRRAPPASSRFSSANSQRFRLFKNIAMRTR